MQTKRIFFSLLGAAVLLAGAALHAQPKAPDSPAPPAEEHTVSKVWGWIFGEGGGWMSLGGVSYGNGGERIVGSDKLVHQLREVSGVRGISLDAPVDVVLKQGQVEKLTLHTDDNIAPLIETRVEDGILRIAVQHGVSFRTRHPIGATVEVPRLNSIRVHGSGDVTCAQFETEHIELTVEGSGDIRMDALKAGALAVLIRGSGDVHLSGTAPQQGFVIEGSGDIEAPELAGHDVAVRIVGSGDASLWARDNLSIEIDGSGNVTYHGQPVVKKQVRGSGDVTHKH